MTNSSIPNLLLCIKALYINKLIFNFIEYEKAIVS